MKNFSVEVHTIIDKFSREWSRISFPGDFISLKAFDNIYQGLILLGSYTAAAVIVPFILDFFVTPMVAVLSTFAILAACAALYQYIFNHEGENKEEINTYVIGAIALGGASILLNYSSLLITLALAATALIRLANTYFKSEQKTLDSSSLKGLNIADVAKTFLNL